MSEEENKETAGKVGELLAGVAERIKNSAPQVLERLRDTLVERELSERVSLLDRAVVKRRELTNELRKVDRPDNVTFNADGSVASGTYSKGRLEEIKKVKEALEKCEKAIEKALADSDFSKLKELIK